MNFSSILMLILTLTVSSAHAGSDAEPASPTHKSIGDAAFTNHEYKPGTIKHIVMFKYKNTVTPEQKNEVIRRFLDLQKSVRTDGSRPYIESISSGFQNSNENADMGFEQAFVVTFTSEGDRNYYVGEPIVRNPSLIDNNHVGFKRFVGPLLADVNGVLVFDFRADSTSS